MKVYINSSKQYDEIEKYLERCIRNVADYAYNHATLRDDDPRADYYVENICEDSEVVAAREQLNKALHDSVDRQNRRYVGSAAEAKKMYNAYLKEEDQLPRLSIKVSEVKTRVLENVLPQDKEVFEYLVENHAIPTIATSSEMRNNPYYDIEDKLIQLMKTSDGYRSYRVPYPGGGRFGSGNVYENIIHVNDNGQIRFGRNDRWMDPKSVKPTTLKAYFFKG